jgi:hypothetical protein
MTSTFSMGRPVNWAVCCVGGLALGRRPDTAALFFHMGGAVDGLCLGVGNIGQLVGLFSMVFAAFGQCRCHIAGVFGLGTRFLKMFLEQRIDRVIIQVGWSLRTT